MISDEPEGNPLTNARKLIQLITESIANADETKSLALMNARSELHFELSLALIELGNDQPPRRNHERRPKNVQPLLDVLEGLARVNEDQHPNPDGIFRQLLATLARAFGYETHSTQLSLIELPRTANELQAVARMVSSFRNNPSGFKSDLGKGQDCSSKSYETTTREGSHVAGDHHNSQGRPYQLTDEQRAAREFMKQAQAFYDEKIRKLDNVKPIKVAVLDTGVKEKEAHFKGVRAQFGTCLKATRSFIGGNCHDTHGHGTEVAALIAEVAPHVDLFIAKVCEDKAINGVDQYVEAIEWAIKQKVHIINISASIDIDTKIESAIIKAKTEGIIVFAAASDNVANHSRAFPASMDEVLAVHSTDGWGTICQGNPRWVFRDPNISTLGENIPSPLDEDELLRGSSYSTAIASGMAANILTIADANLGASEGDRRVRDRAFKTEGMAKIFVKVSENWTRDDYHFVCPSRIARLCDERDSYRHWLKDALD